MKTDTGCGLKLTGRKLYTERGTVYNLKKKGFRIIPADSLIPDEKGEYFRQWRPQIKKPDDIWNEIVKVTNIPGLTSAPKLQPIETRLDHAFNRYACSDGIKGIWT